MKRFALVILLVAAVTASAFVVLNRPGAEASTGATITVNTWFDDNSRDDRLSLREAMMLATGDLLFTLLSEEECAQVSTVFWLEEPIHWCAGATGNPPGADYADTIVFANLFLDTAYITVGPTHQHLPTLDAGDDTIDASSSSTTWIVECDDPQFNAAFGITSDNNTIKGMEIHNCDSGVTIADGAQNNTVGGSTEGDRNVLSGNNQGVLIYGSGTTGNVVKGNYIGTNAAGDAALPNMYGVWIDAEAQNNTVGGSNPGEGNVISGNSDSGVYLAAFFGDEGAYGNVVKGNYIGTDASGTVAVPNGGNGVHISEGANNNTIGGSSLGEGNVISGNHEEGVLISGAATDGNAVKGNFIGTDASGTVALPNGGAGVSIVYGAQDNTVGGSGPGEGNVISGNGLGGVYIGMVTGIGVQGNVVKGNYIGTDASGTVAIPNGRQGVSIGFGIEFGPQNNTIGGTGAGEGNLIAFNDANGVAVGTPGTTGNTIRGNSIHSNGELGIWLTNGGNEELEAPTIEGVGSVFGTACANCTIDVYSDDEDEGRVYEGSTTADGDGDWIFSGWPEGPNATATATDSDGNTSEFSAPVTVPEPPPTPTPSPTPLATPMPPAPGQMHYCPEAGKWSIAVWSGENGMPIEEALAFCPQQVTAAYRIDPDTQAWTRYFRGRPEISNLTSLDNGQGVIALGAAVSAASASDDGRLRAAANGMLGCPEAGRWAISVWTGASGASTEQAVASCSGASVVTAYWIDPETQAWKRYFDGRPEISNLTTLDQMQGIVTLGAAGVLPSTARIAFVTDRDGDGEIYVMNADGAGQTNLTNNPAWDDEPMWSPGGSKIAFASVPFVIGTLTLPEIYVMNADGSGQTNLTNDPIDPLDPAGEPAADLSPIWSPDGSKIAFYSSRGQEIYVMNPDGSGLTQLTAGGDAGRHLAWSPDGSTIAFAGPIFTYDVVLTPDMDNPVSIVNADGSGQMRLTQDPARDPAWSPDGSKIAFSSSRDGNREIYVVNADGTGLTNLTEFSSASDLEPAWSPDGTRIAFVSDREGSSDIYLMNADGTSQTRLTTDGGDDVSPAWSPDGSKIAFVSDREGSDDIYLMNADGSEQTSLTDDPARDVSPVWSPDGSKIAFVTDRDSNYEIYVMNADGTGQTNLTKNPAWDDEPIWSP